MYNLKYKDAFCLVCRKKLPSKPFIHPGHKCGKNKLPVVLIDDDCTDKYIYSKAMEKLAHLKTKTK